MNPKTITVMIGSLFLGFGVSYVFGGGKEQDIKDVVRARTFELINEKGEVSGRITSYPQGYPGICIVIGDSQMPAVTIIKKNEDLAIGVGEANPEMLFGLIVSEHQGAEIVIESRSTNHKARIGVNKNKIPFIELVDDNKWMVTPQSR